MQLDKALKIGHFLTARFAVACVPGHCVIAGSARRRKAEVHDLEIVAMPIQRAPQPEFGQKFIDKTLLDKELRLLEKEGYLKRVLGGEKFKKYEIRRLEDFGAASMFNPFHLDLFLVTPPSQWGVELLIRTGPGDFSQWMVTQKSKRGALPDGWFVRHNVVWRVGVEVPNKAQEAVKVMNAETMVEMSNEEDYFRFCGMKPLEPSKRFSAWSYE